MAIIGFGYYAFRLHKYHSLIRILDAILNEVTEDLFKPPLIHVYFIEDSEVFTSLSGLHLDVKSLLHSLIPEQVLHVLQEGVQAELAEVRAELVRVHPREVKDI
jgi:hypothetical protein